MASLMDLRELGMLRNATQRMERGGGIDMDEWRRRKAAEEKAKEQSMLEQAMALNADDPRYQALISGAEGGPFAVGAVGSVARSLPFLRAGPAAVDAAKSVGRGVSTAGKYLKNKLWSPGYSGAPRKGAMVFGRNASGKSIKRIAKEKGEWKYSGRPTKAGALTAEAIGVGVGGGVLYNALKENDLQEEEVMTPGIGGGGAIGLPQKKQTSDDEPPPEKTDSLWETWGSLADDPRKRKQAYLGSIKNIYMKKMMLDSIANLTGGKSQGDSWATMAIAELDAVEKFDSEERTHQKWKALFFNEDGTYNPPNNREEAIKRGGQLGYDADQMKDILTVFPKDTSTTKGGVATEQYEIWKEMDEGELKEAYGNIINVNRGSDRGKITAYQAAGLLANDALDLSDEQKAALTAIMDTGIGVATTGGASTEGEKPVTVSTQAEYDALASGTLYVDGSGEQKRKP
jgi:hypothetical protein